MKRFAYLMFCALFAPIALQAQGLEGTARPLFNPTRELEMMRMVPVCGPNTPVVVSGTRLVCGTSLIPSCPQGTPVVVSGTGLACASSSASACVITINNVSSGCPLSGSGTNAAPACPAGFTSTNIETIKCGESSTGNDRNYQTRSCWRITC